MAPVQIQILGNVGGFPNIRILLRESSHNGAGSRYRVLKIVTLIKFRADFGQIRAENHAGATQRLRYDSASPESGGRDQGEKMANYSTSEFKSGLRIILDGDPCVIVENEFVKPGKGQAFSRVRIRNLKTGKTVDKTFKSGESVEAADVRET